MNRPRTPVTSPTKTADRPHYTEPRSCAARTQPAWDRFALSLTDDSLGRQRSRGSEGNDGRSGSPTVRRRAGAGSRASTRVALSDSRSEIPSEAACGGLRLPRDRGARSTPCPRLGDRERGPGNPWRTACRRDAGACLAGLPRAARGRCVWAVGGCRRLSAAVGGGEGHVGAGGGPGGVAAWPPGRGTAPPYESRVNLHP